MLTSKTIVVKTASGVAQKIVLKVKTRKNCRPRYQIISFKDTKRNGSVILCQSELLVILFGQSGTYYSNRQSIVVNTLQDGQVDIKVVKQQDTDIEEKDKVIIGQITLPANDYKSLQFALKKHIFDEVVTFSNGPTPLGS